MTTRETLLTPPPGQPREGGGLLDEVEFQDEHRVLNALFLELADGLGPAFQILPDDGVESDQWGTFAALDALDDNDRDELEIGRQPVFHPAHVAHQPIIDVDRRSAAVSWTISAANGGRFFGLANTNRVVRINGSTSIVTSDDGTKAMHFIDWTDVIAQMGVGIAARVIPEGRPDFNLQT